MTVARVHTVCRRLATAGLAAAGTLALIWFGGTPDQALYLCFLLLVLAALAALAALPGLGGLATQSAGAPSRLAAGPTVLAAVGVLLLATIALRPTLPARGLTLAGVWWLSLFLTLVLTEGRPASQRRWVLALLLAGAGEALFGIFQAVGGFDRIGSFERGMGSMATGTFVNRNHFAAFVNLALMLGVGALHGGLAGRARAPWRRSEAIARSWLVILGCAVLGWAVVLSRSRGGALSLAAVLLVVSLAMVAHRRQGRGVPILIAALLVVSIAFAGAAAGLVPLLDRFEEIGADDRLAVFRGTVEMIADHPLGIGPGMYELRFRPYQTVALDLRFHHAHSDPLEILAEWGLPIGLALLGFLGWTLARLVRSFRRAEDPALRGLLLGLGGALAVVLLHGLTENNLQIPATAVAFWVLVGLAWTATARADNPARAKWPAAPLRWLLLAALLAAGWQVFHRFQAVRIEEGTRGLAGHLEALSWDPENPELHADLARRYRQAEPPDLAAAITAWRRAAELSPRNWRYQMEMSRAYELAGRSAEAEAAMVRAVELSPRAPKYRWRLADLYLRRGEIEKALPLVAEVVATDRGRREEALSRLTEAGASLEAIDHVWPRDRPSRLELLRLILAAWDPEPRRRYREFVANEWDKLLAGDDPPAVEEGLFYVAQIVRAERPVRARRFWIQLQRAAGSHDPAYARGENWVWNGGFEKPTTSSPFDWSLEAPSEVAVRIAPGEGLDGSAAARLDFSGGDNTRLVSLRQRLAVDVEGVPSLEFSFAVRARDLTTDRGVYFELVDTWTGAVFVRTEPVTGTLPWTRRAAVFELPEESVSLELRLRRDPSLRFDNKISGTVWLDEVALRLRESDS